MGQPGPSWDVCTSTRSDVGALPASPLVLLIRRCQADGLSVPSGAVRERVTSFCALGSAVQSTACSCDLCLARPSGHCITFAVRDLVGLYACVRAADRAAPGTASASMAWRLAPWVLAVLGRMQNKRPGVCRGSELHSEVTDTYYIRRALRARSHPGHCLREEGTTRLPRCAAMSC